MVIVGGEAGGWPSRWGRWVEVPVAASPCTDAAAQPASSGVASANGSAPHRLVVQAVSRQQARHDLDEGAQDVGHVGGRGRRRGVKSEGAGRGPREHPVEHQGVYVDMEIHRPAEALNDGDPAAARVGEPLVARPAPQVPLDRPVQQAGDAPAQVVVPGQHVPDPMRHTPDPLADRHVGQDVVDEVRRTFGHAPTATTRTETSPLAQERDEPLGLAATAAEAREAAGEESTPQKRPELVLDETGQPVAVAERGRLGPERLEMVAHNRVEDRCAGVSRRVLGQAHARGARVSRANMALATQRCRGPLRRL